MTVCGIDSGTPKSLSYVAWLIDNRFIFDVYMPTVDHPLPTFPNSGSDVLAFALDCPQSLPIQGNSVRKADKLAQTPTKKLPTNRQELETWKAYGGLIRCGITIFWSIYHKRLARIEGLDHAAPSLRVAETYPRYVIKRLWPTVKIPSKRKDPITYINVFWPKILNLGFYCSSVHRPSVDQVDAAICAIVAHKMMNQAEDLAGTVGMPPIPDENELLLREGYIISQ